MLPFLNRRSLAVSDLPKLFQTVLILFLIISNTIAKKPRYNSLTNKSISNHFTFNYNYVNNYINTQGYKSVSASPIFAMETETNSLQTPPNDNDNEDIYHDTIQRESNSNSNSVTSENLSTTSKINPITLNQPHSPFVPGVFPPELTFCECAGLSFVLRRRCADSQFFRILRIKMKNYHIMMTMGMY
jgi:hypothetical protein